MWSPSLLTMLNSGGGGVRRAEEVHVPSQQPPHVPPIFSGYAASWLDAIAQDAKWLTVATGP